MSKTKHEIKYKAYVPELKKIVDVFGINPMNQTVYLSHQQLFGRPGDDILMSYADPLDKYDTPVKLMQFTGLKDKNGVEIYEGYIISTGAKQHTFIDYQAPSFVLRWLTPKGNKGTAWSDIAYDSDGIAFGEVIGNIHKNPELLEANK